MTDPVPDGHFAARLIDVNFKVDETGLRWILGAQAFNFATDR